MVTKGYSQVVKRPVREANHPLPSTAEMKEWWSHNFIPQHAFKARVQLREQITLRR
jgi:P2-related tail formation protein